MLWYLDEQVSRLESLEVLEAVLNRLGTKRQESMETEAETIWSP